MSAGPASQFPVASVEGITVVQINAPKLALEAGEHLTSLVESARPDKLLLDFSSVHFLSSAGLAVLVNLKKRLEGYGARLMLCSLESSLVDLLRITRLKDLFEIHSTQAEAVAAGRA